MAEPHVVVDARPAFVAGVGRYLRNLVPRLAALSPDWRFTLLGDANRLARAGWAAAPNVRHVDCRAPGFSVREQLQIPRRIPRDARVFWSPNYNIPLASRLPLVVTVHDVAHLRLPEFTHRAARRAYATAMFGTVRRRAAAIMYDSKFSQEEFRDTVGAVNGRTVAEVIHLGIDAEWFATPAKEERPIEGRYFVFVGDPKPNKNLPTLLRAFDRVSRDLDASLVLIGRPDSQLRTPDAELTAVAARLGDRVRWLGEVDDATLRAHVRHAIALVQPSTYEGFGFPPLEAMAAGTPAIVSRAGSLPEVCGDAALYFNPLSVDELAGRLREVAGSDALRERMSREGRLHVRRYDWDLTAAKVHDVFRRVLHAA